MKLKTNRIAAATFAALGVAFAGASMAEMTAKDKSAQATETKSVTTERSTTTDTRFDRLNGVAVRDASGTQLGTIKSYSTIDGQVNATIVNPAGTESKLILGSPDVLATELPASGSLAITVDSNGVVQHPIGVTTSTTTTSPTTSSSSTGMPGASQELSGTTSVETSPKVASTTTTTVKKPASKVKSTTTTTTTK